MKANETLEFFVALHTQNHYWNDLEVKRGTFKVQLYADDEPALLPDKIKRLNHERNGRLADSLPDGRSIADRVYR